MSAAGINLPRTQPPHAAAPFITTMLDAGVDLRDVQIAARSPEDEEFVATCLELPSLSWLAPTQDVALHGLRGLVEDVAADLRRNG